MIEKLEKEMRLDLWAICIIGGGLAGLLLALIAFRFDWPRALFVLGATIGLGFITVGAIGAFIGHWVIWKKEA